MSLQLTVCNQYLALCTLVILGRQPYFRTYSQDVRSIFVHPYTWTSALNAFHTPPMALVLTYCKVL